MAPVIDGSHTLTTSFWLKPILYSSLNPLDKSRGQMRALRALEARVLFEHQCGTVSIGPNQLHSTELHSITAAFKLQDLA